MKRKENTVNRKRKAGIFVSIILLLTLIGGGVGELYARRGLGLGDPPLSIADSKIEYLFAPNQDCRRFGNRIVYNDVSMRNDYPSSVLTNGERRVMMLGDSVLNGGVLTDHAKLATTLAESALRAEGRHIRILNCSAGSWGPVNCAEYMRKYGSFGAEAIYVVLNPGDLWDVPDHTPIVGTRSFPDKKPVSALWELVYRYIVPRVESFWEKKTSRLVSRKDLVRGGMTKDAAEKASLAALKYCFSQAPERGVIYSRVVGDWTAPEETEGERKLRAFCKENGYAFYLLQLDPSTDYRKNDVIHLNDNGQRKLADLLVRIVAKDGGSRAEP